MGKCLHFCKQETVEPVQQLGFKCKVNFLCVGTIRVTGRAHRALSTDHLARESLSSSRDHLISEQQNSWGKEELNNGNVSQLTSL